MLVGRPFIWKCDFCIFVFHREGYGLPRGWKWLAGNVTKGTRVRHICPDCQGEGKHGDEALHESGRYTKVKVV